MKVSIITVTYNSGNTIYTTLNSVKSQTWNSIEHIIIDGNSTDNTVEIVNNFPHVSKVIVENDDGIYDAMNKGIENSSGDVIGFLNSDDWFFNDNVIEDIVNCFRNNKIDAVYGDLVFVVNENDSQYKRSWKSEDYKKNSFLSGWVPPHPTFYVKKEIFKKFGVFNKELKFAADYDLMLRFIEKEKIKTIYMPGPKIKMRFGGETTKNIKNVILGNIEIFNSLKNNGFKPGISFWFKKIKYKLKQFSRMS